MEDSADLTLPDVDDSELDERLSSGRRVDLTRSRVLGHHHLQVYSSALWESEQETIRESMRRQIIQDERGTSPEQLFRGMRDLINEHGGSVVFATTDDDRVVPVTGEERMPWFGLDDAERMEVGDLSRAELVNEIEGELEERSREEITQILDEDASRDTLLRMVAALRSRDG